MLLLELARIKQLVMLHQQDECGYLVQDLLTLILLKLEHHDCDHEDENHERHHVCVCDDDRGHVCVVLSSTDLLHRHLHGSANAIGAFVIDLSQMYPSK